MGIDIYLNGYDGYEKRIVKEKAEFEAAVKQRDALPAGPKHDAAQDAVNVAADKMWAGNVGYLRSSYNGSGLFRVLEEIFGFDTAEYFFPGDWDKQGDEGIPIDGEKFVAKVVALRNTVLHAVKNNHRALPWIEDFTAVTGERAPDPNPAHAKAELFGDSVFATISKLGMDKVEGGPQESAPEFGQRHVWYLTHGLQDLYDFGKLAKQLNDAGEKTFAYISF